MIELTHADLFAGYGGFSLGFEATGMIKPAVFCEYDEWLQKLLAQRWPNIPIEKDIRNFEYDRTVDLVTAGFPCQPHSHAGKRRGSEDDRDLWPETLAAIKRLKPTVFIGENVTGLASMALETLSFTVESRICNRYADYDHFEGVYTRQEKMYLGKICEDLSAEGYEVIVFEIPALAAGANHKRARLWIIAYSDSERSYGRTAEHGKNRRQESPGSSQDMADSYGNAQQQCAEERHKTRHGLSNGREIIAAAESICLSGYWRYWHEKSAFPDSCGAGLEGAKQCQDDERKAQAGQESPARAATECNSDARGYWPVEPAVGRVVNGCTDRAHRIKALGNGIAPPVAYVLAMAILIAIYGYKNEAPPCSS